MPTSRIIKLAREIANVKPCFIEQGWGPQRHQNGEQSSRAIATLACMTGNVGILGGNTGLVNLMLKVEISRQMLRL
ncbi:molybdopterin-dependent oxidoreductase [Campylobacter portucalensis]|uniref:molybdopterin-dependent oxidoreductase n=1 Tax=Campylobacter portucalensis TaxID=2608384 RepID=UPI0018A6C4FE|nr:molybdopterin-dependent oxidoreductase [Campylobacter portucalensis]